jgi:hypothetical protein
MLTNNHSGSKLQTLFIFKDNLDINVWHKKMGCISEQHLKLTSKNEMVRGLNIKPPKRLVFCPSYLHRKQLECNKFLIGQSRRAKEILELIHSEIVWSYANIFNWRSKMFFWLL